MLSFTDDFIRAIMKNKQETKKMHLLNKASDASRDELFNTLIFAVQNVTTTDQKISMYWNDKSLIITSHPELTRRDLTKLVDGE